MKPEPSRHLMYFGMMPDQWKPQALADLQFHGGRLLDTLNPDWREELDGTGHTPFGWILRNGMHQAIRDGLTALANWVLYLSEDAINEAMPKPPEPPEPEPVEVPEPDFHRWEYMLSVGGLE